MDRIRIDDRTTWSLVVQSLVASACLIGLLVSGIAAFVVFREPRGSASGGAYAVGERLLSAFLSFAYGLSASFAVLFCLTMIESIGIRFFGARRGWRITKTVARTVCAHACVGWVIGAALLVVSTTGVVLWRWLQQGPIPKWPAIALLAAPLMVGLLTFETLVYIGMRRCKFANRAKSADFGKDAEATDVA